MIFARHTPRYLFAVFCALILSYFAHYLSDSSFDSLVLNGDQRLGRDQSYTKNKKNIIENKNTGYMNNIIKDLLGNSKLRGIYTNKMKSNVTVNFNTLTELNVDADDIRQWAKSTFKPAPGNVGNDRPQDIPSVEKTIRDRMFNYSLETVIRENSKATVVKNTGEIKKANNSEVFQHAAKNYTSIHSMLLNPESKTISISSGKGVNIYKSKRDPNTYYSYSNTIITPVNHAFLISNEDLCETSSPEVIILVLSSPNNVEQRKVIRSTYGTISRDRKSNIYGTNVEFVVRTIFLIGKSSSTQLTNSVFDENEKHSDIVLIDYIDSYRDLTTKVLHGFKWINEFCSNVSYVMKADDDVFINVAVLTKRLKEYQYMKNGTVFGHVYDGYRAVARTGKWAVTYEEFPLESFPDYMSGASYTMTINLIPKILYTAQRLPFLPIEDAFITGVIANRIHGAQMVHWKDNSFWNYQIPVPCDFIKGQLSMTNMTPQLMNESWSILISNGSKPGGTRCHRK